VPEPRCATVHAPNDCARTGDGSFRSSATVALLGLPSASAPLRAAIDVTRASAPCATLNPLLLGQCAMHERDYDAAPLDRPTASPRHAMDARQRPVPPLRTPPHPCGNSGADSRHAGTGRSVTGVSRWIA
jgi:hypothetical protein